VCCNVFLTFSLPFRCPYQDDRYLTTLVPVGGSSALQFPTHYKRFVVKMFTFVDPASLAPLQETVCSAALPQVLILLVLCSELYGLTLSTSFRSSSTVVQQCAILLLAPVSKAALGKVSACCKLTWEL